MIINLNQHGRGSRLEAFIKKINDAGAHTLEVKAGGTPSGIIVQNSLSDEFIEQIEKDPIVKSVTGIKSRFKRASREVQSTDSIIELDHDVKIGGGHFAIIAGPCSVEGEENFNAVADSVVESGADIVRGGAYKPRTSPYDFQGMGKEGLAIMAKAGDRLKVPVVSEVMAVTQIDEFDGIDIYQIGSRNMQNFELLKAVGKTNKPVLLKRGMSATIDEWLMCAEYIMSEGNDQVILCERGIRTYETQTRNTLDISAVAAIKAVSHLPVVVDPSHAAGRTDLIDSLSLAAVAAGADGLVIEVHNDPRNAWSDGEQSLTFDHFEALVPKINQLNDCMKQID